jgi:5,10-methylenetetrahydrofolate reductase
MLILAELRPKSNMRKLEEQLKKLSYYDGIDIPDSPLGEPTVPPIAVAAVARKILGDDVEIIINQRLADVNELFVRSLAKGAKLLNVSIAFTKGDKPRVGREVGYLTSESAVAIAKAAEGIRAGMILSLRKPISEIKARMNSHADFFLAVRLSKPEMLDGLENSKVLPYVIVKTDKNSNVVEELGQPYVDYREISEFVRKLEDYNPLGILLSSPGDEEWLYKGIHFL